MKRRSLLPFLEMWIIFFYFGPTGYAQTVKPATEIKVRLIDRLDTSNAKNGQTFSAMLAEPVSLAGGNVLARGALVRGVIAVAVNSEKLKSPASITLALTRLGKTPVRTESLRIDSNSHATRDSVMIIGKQEIVLPPETQLTFMVSRSTGAEVRAPEPNTESNAGHVMQPTPASWHYNSREDSDDAYDDLIFSEHDEWLIRSYFKSNYGNLPLALAKRGGDLPAGLEKHLRADQTLPRELMTRVEPLPSELEHQLPRLPFGYSREVLSGRVMILGDDGEIVDLMFIYR